MLTVNLTPAFVRSAGCDHPHRRVDYFETEWLPVGGAFVGCKTFYQGYNDTRGRLKQCKLSAAEILTVEQARETGREIVAAALLGADPQARVDLRAVLTLPEFVQERYLPSNSSWPIQLGKGQSLPLLWQTLFVLTAGSDLYPVQDAEAVKAAQSRCKKLNAYLCQRARDGGEITFLASP